VDNVVHFFGMSGKMLSRGCCAEGEVLEKGAGLVDEARVRRAVNDLAQGRKISALQRWRMCVGAAYRLLAKARLREAEKTVPTDEEILAELKALRLVELPVQPSLEELEAKMLALPAEPWWAGIPLLGPDDPGFEEAVAKDRAALAAAQAEFAAADARRAARSAVAAAEERAAHEAQLARAGTPFKPAPRPPLPARVRRLRCAAPDGAAALVGGAGGGGQESDEEWFSSGDTETEEGEGDEGWREVGPASVPPRPGRPRRVKRVRAAAESVSPKHPMAEQSGGGRGARKQRR
jgi:hypothetical protein